jgi:ADP-heptose:LPS heptosyltransferase
MEDNHKSIIVSAKKIAVIRTDRLGDMVLTLPMCNSLKQNLPNSKICLIARKYVSDLLYQCPAIDEVLYLEDNQAGINHIFRHNKFDAVFFPRPKLEEAWASFINHVPLRIGSGYRYYSFLFNHRIYTHRKDAARHECEYNNDMVANILEIPLQPKLVKPVIQPEAEKLVNDLLVKYNITSEDKFIIVHPGSGGSARDWDAGNFGKVASVLTDELKLKVIVTGTLNEKPSCDKVLAESSTALNFCGKLNLSGLMALLERSSLMMSNSTGVLHIAAALGTPVIGLYPNSPHISSKRWGPYSPNSITISPPDKEDHEFRDDMTKINVIEVVNAAKTNFISV